jgi:tetratricopeptide (TPR) repeat protein
MPPVFDPEKLVDLVHELHLLGFEVSTEQCAAAQDLLIALAAHGHSSTEPRRLSTWLAPVLCTSPEEQKTFHEQFGQWVERQSSPEQRERGLEKRTEDAGGTPAETVKKRIGPRRRSRWLAAAVVLAVAVVAAAVTAVILIKNSLPQILSGYVVDQDKNPIGGAAVVVGGHSSISDSQGQFSFTYKPKDLPTEIAVSREGYEALNFELNTTNNVPPLSITLVKQKPQAPATMPPPAINTGEAFVAAPVEVVPQPGGWSQTYRNYFRPVQAGAVLLPMLVFGVWLLRRAYDLRRLRLVRRGAAEQPVLNNMAVKSAVERLFQGRAYRRAFQELRRHRQAGSNDLDPQDTVNATIRRGGWFTPVYSLRLVQPEYLALIDRAGYDDQQARLVNELVGRLVRDGVTVERYHFHGSPLISRGEDLAAPHFSLSDLAARYPKHNLLLFSDGAGLLNPLTGEPQSWLDILMPWPVRALLTPEEPGNWGYPERALAERGFIVVPGSKAGLVGLTEIINTGNPPRYGDGGRAQPFPEMVQERPWRWVERHRPERAVVNQLCFELRRFLGDDGYNLLAACAVYPMLHWELTVYLGYKLGARELVEERLRSLVRLPWFRHGCMPDWLRLRLISALSRKDEELTRDALAELLLSSLEKSRSRSFSLPYIKGGLTGAGERGWKRLRQSLARKVQLWERGKRWRDLIRSSPKQSPLRDFVFLTFMFGVRPSKLSLSVPNTLRRVLFPEGHAALGLRPSSALALAALFSVVAFATLPRPEQPAATEQPRVAEDVQPQATPTPSEPYSAMTAEEQLAFIEQRAKHISVMLSGEPGVFNEGALRFIKQFVDIYARRVGNNSKQIWGEDTRFLLARGSQFAPVISAAFRERGVPPVVGLYIAMIETEYHNICSENSAGAAGILPFVPGTARFYGLDPKDRCDVKKSAETAARYMADRTAEFGTGPDSMQLAILSYSRAPGSVMRDIRTLARKPAAERNVWFLIDNAGELDAFFQNEAVKYVPRFFAAAIVGETPQAFGIQTAPLSTYTVIDPAAVFPAQTVSESPSDRSAEAGDPDAAAPDGRTPDPVDVSFGSDVPEVDIYVDGLLVGRTDRDGRLLIKLAPGEHTVIARKAGYFLQKRELNIGPGLAAFRFFMGPAAATPESASTINRFRDPETSSQVTSAEWQNLLSSTYQELSKTPNDMRLRAQALFAQGQIEYLGGNYAEALVAFQQALLTTPDYGLAHHGLGQVYLATNRPREAIRAFERAVVIDPQSGMSHKGMGDSWTMLRRQAEAAAAYERALSLGYPSQGALDMARKSVREGRWNEALSTLQALTALEPSAEVFILLGDAYTGQHQPLNAFHAYKKAVELDSNSATAYYKLGEIHLRERDYEAARSALERALTLDPDGRSIDRKKARAMADAASTALRKPPSASTPNPP